MYPAPKKKLIICHVKIRDAQIPILWDNSEFFFNFYIKKSKQKGQNIFLSHLTDFQNNMFQFNVDSKKEKKVLNVRKRD